jgi:hypothetical protein
VVRFEVPRELGQKIGFRLAKGEATNERDLPSGCVQLTAENVTIHLSCEVDS